MGKKKKRGSVTQTNGKGSRKEKDWGGCKNSSPQKENGPTGEEGGTKNCSPKNVNAERKIGEQTLLKVRGMI